MLIQVFDFSIRSVFKVLISAIENCWLLEPLHIDYDLIRLPAIRCEFGEINAKYQMQLRLRDLASPANPPKYPSIHINKDTLSTSMHRFSSYLKMKFVNSYPNMCNLEGCFVFLNLN